MHEHVVYSQKKETSPKLSEKWKKIGDSKTVKKIAKKIDGAYAQVISWLFKANKKEKEIIEKLKKIKPIENILDLHSPVSSGVCVYKDRVVYGVFYFYGYNRVNNLVRKYNIKFEPEYEAKMDIVVYLRSLTEENFHEALRKLVWAKKLYDEIKQQQKITAEEVAKRWVEVKKIANEKNDKCSKRSK